MEAGALKCVVAAMKTHSQHPQIQDWGSQALGAGQPNFREIYPVTAGWKRVAPCQVLYVREKMMTLSEGRSKL